MVAVVKAIHPLQLVLVNLQPLPLINLQVKQVLKHHNLKKDAPSGTAIMIAEALNNELGNKMHYVYDRHNVRKAREADEIGLHSIRGGTIVGFFGNLDLEKTVNGDTPSSNQEFTFVLEKLKDEVDVSEYNTLKGQDKTDEEIFLKIKAEIAEKVNKIISLGIGHLTLTRAASTLSTA